MTFAVFNYNNCELTNSSNEEEIEDEVEEIVSGTPKSGGSETTPKSGGTKDDTGLELLQSGGSGDDGQNTSSYDLKLEAYTGSNFIPTLLMDVIVVIKEIITRRAWRCR